MLSRESSFYTCEGSFVMSVSCSDDGVRSSAARTRGGGDRRPDGRRAAPAHRLRHHPRHQQATQDAGQFLANAPQEPFQRSHAQHEGTCLPLLI